MIKPSTPNPTAILAAALLVFACASTAGAASATPIPLFNGTNLDGWVIENGGRFSVENGVIRLDHGVGWLRSADTFGDFRLVMEFRFLEPDANSGIFVRTGATSHADENGWPDNGYQIQCRDTIGGDHPLATMIPYGGGEFEHRSDLEALKRAYRPTGEWQVYDITCSGDTMSIRLNGIEITTCTGIRNREGHIGIQGEHGLLEFRKIEVTPLD